MKGPDHNYRLGSVISANSHSLSYALMAGQTLWLRHYYPLEYLCACFITETYISNKDEKIKKFSAFLKACKKRDIKVFKPDINKSNVDFAIEGDSIRYGLAAIKEIGSFAQVLVNLRNELGNFKSFDDFLFKINSKKLLASSSSKIEVLIKVGCFAKIEQCDKEVLIAKLRKAIKISKQNKQRESLFNQFEFLEESNEPIEPIDNNEILKEYLHFAI